MAQDLAKTCDNIGFACATSGLSSFAPRGLRRPISKSRKCRPSLPNLQGILEVHFITQRLLKGWPRLDSSGISARCLILVSKVSRNGIPLASFAKTIAQRGLEESQVADRVADFA